MTDEELKAQAVQSLHTFQQAAALAGMRWFLHAGTLLGAVRDNDFCPGDADDIDVGVFDGDFDKMGLVTEGGWFRVLERFIYKERIEGVKIALADSDVHIDVCRMRTHPTLPELYDLGTLNINEKRVYCANVYPGWNYKELEVVTFQGVQVNIPRQAEVILRWRYGSDWRFPIHREDWHWLEHIPSKAIRLEYYDI